MLSISIREVSFMDTLPLKVLKNILKFIPEHELNIVKRVCPYWERLIDNEFGIPVFIGEGRNYLPATSTKLIREIGISKAYFCQVEEQIPLEGFKHPHLVREICFDGFICDKSFAVLLAQLPNLEKVKIHTSTLCYLRQNFLKGWDLPKLSALHIACSYSAKKREDELWSYANDHVLDSIDVILRANIFPCLKCLVLNMFFVPKREEEMKEAILQCLWNHRDTLRMLEMEYYCEGESNEDESKMEAADASSWLEKIDGSQLGKFSLRFYYDGGPKTDFWIEFIRGQYSLSSFNYVCQDGLTPFPAEVITRNQVTLVNIHLRVSVKEEEFDCAVFQGCVHLKGLGLENKCGKLPAGGFNLMSSPLLKNPNLIPKNLRYILLTNFKLTKSDAAIIAFQFPKLEELSLRSIGTRGDFGIAFKDLTRILEERILKRITILDGVNEESLEDVISSDQDEDNTPENALIFAGLGTDIECYLTDGGFYSCPYLGDTY